MSASQLINISETLAILVETRRLLTEVGWWRGSEGYKTYMMGAIDENDQLTGLQATNIKAYTLNGAFQKAMFNISGHFHTGTTGKMAELYLEAAICSITDKYGRLHSGMGHTFNYNSNQQEILFVIDKTINAIQTGWKHD